MKKIFCLIAIVIIFVFTGCLACSSNAQQDSPRYQNYKEIPEITQAEIAAVEELLATKPDLVYGVSTTTEAFLRDDGSIGGFSELLTNRMSQLFGFDFTLRPLIWSDLIDGLLSGEIDFTGELTLTPERLETYFMTEAIAQRSVKVFSKIKMADLREIAKTRPLKGAFLEGSTMYSIASRSWDLPFEPVYINDEFLVPDMLLNDEIDIFIGEGVFEAYFEPFDFVRMENYYPLSYSPVSLTTGNPELKPIIDVMQKYLKNGGYDELIDLYNQGYSDYSRQRLFNNLTTEEKEYISLHNQKSTAISVAYDAVNYPTSFYNSKEKAFQGIAFDILQQVSKMTGLTFKAGTNKDTLWPELLEGLENGTYAIATELLQTTAKKDRFLWTDTPYFSDYYALISTIDYPDVDINRVPLKRIGLLEGTAYTDVFLEWFPNTDKIVMYDDRIKACDALEKGEIDLLMGSQSFLLHLINYLERPDFKINISFDYFVGSYFGFNKNEALLCSIINKAQQYIDTDMISENWKRKVFDYESKILQDLLPLGIAAVVILLIALVGVFVVLVKNRRINRNLDKTVGLRTNELEKQTSILERRLKQQNLMASLSQIFITEGDINGQITKFLKLIGEFLDVSRVLLGKYEENSFNYLYEWDNPLQTINSRQGTTLNIADEEMKLVVAYSKREVSYFCLDHTNGKDFLQRYQLNDLKNFILLPIYTDGELWGVLEFDRCEEYLPWTDNDINLGETVAGILSGVMSRQKIEDQLVQLSSIVENSPQFITTVYSGGGFAYYNQAAIEITGFSREELDAGGLGLLLSDENYKRIKEEILPVILRDKKCIYEMSFVTKNKGARVMSVSAFSMKSDASLICSIASDITDLVEMQRKLEHQTAELALQTATLSTMFSSLPDSVFCKDLNLCYTRCNKNFENYLGCREEEIIGKSEEAAFGMPIGGLKNLREIEQRVINEKIVVPSEEHVLSASGEVRIFETIRTPLIKEGNAIGLMGIARDITQRKTAEETLKLTLDNLDACVYISDIDTGEILFINNKMTSEYGGSGCLGKKCWEVLQKDFTERCDFCPIPKLLESGDDNYVWEERSSVTGKYYRNTDNLMKWHDGRLVHMQHSVDITDIKTAQTALNKRLQQQSLMTYISQSFLSNTAIDTLITNALRMVGEFMEIAQVLCYKLADNQLSFSCQNEWIDPNLGLASRIGEEMHITDVMMPFLKRMSTDREFCFTSNEPAFKSVMAPYRVNFENYITTPLFVRDKLYGVLDFCKTDSDELWSESDINLAVLVSSLLSGFFERQLIESELIKSKESAEQGSRSKSDFLSRMSHEIRTPLNAVIGMNGIAMNTNDPVKMRDCHEKIDNASKHLLGVINDILDMSKIEADKFELSYSEFDFEKTIMNITNVINFRAEEKHQNVIVNLSGDVPDFIFGDELRLAQVITNLLSNAVKFTPENGTIILNIQKINDENDEVTLQIDVSDTGIGISKEQQSRLFTSFEQADGSISRKFGGTGLGLAISKRIVQLMGGNVWVESELGKGSKFIFTIKAKKGKGKTHAKLSPKINKDNIQILAVDDSLDVRLCFTNIMNAHGLPCDTAASGAEALEKIKEHTDRPYNVFFVDWLMPEMDGIELTKRIKKITGDNSVVFMISVADWNCIEAEAVSVGVRQFVPKPLFPSILINAVNECFGVETAKAEVRSANIADKLRLDNCKILIAEDVEINQEIMSAILEEVGASVDFAENGRIAVSTFEANPDKYNLILMDIHMPEMDGYEATRIIRSLKLNQAKTIPIIAMTANVFKEDVDHCLEAGMNDHVGKPINAEDLFTKIKKHLH